ncbi:MAG: hypothetical protein M1817_003759 [Caeruleum heppii]|nr:MAG: hypothetical protein M1817_003759 [Caeruleum heppii]
MAQRPITFTTEISSTVTVALGSDFYSVQSDTGISLARFSHDQLLEATSDGNYVPATILPYQDSTIVTDEYVEAIARDFEERDDVWSRSFLSALILPTTLQGFTGGDNDVLLLRLNPAVVRPQPGPYLIHRLTGCISAVAKLYQDPYGAFVCSVAKRLNAPGSFETVMLRGPIKVPSRLFYTPSHDKPLAGFRFAVKDVIDIAGCKTGCGNEGYRNVYPEASRNATVVQQLLDAGAILVGKTKTTQFGEGSDPTDCRAPAGVNGVYGSRPSTSFTSSYGVFPVSAQLDTVGVFTRSAALMGRVGSIMMSQAYSLPQHVPLSRRRYKLLYPVRTSGASASQMLRWFPYPGEPGIAPEAEAEMEVAVCMLESHLGCSRETFNLDDLWEKTRPAGEPASLDEATGKLYSILTTYSQVDVISKFLADFRLTNGGRLPFIDPIVLARQQFGRQQTREAFLAAVRAKSVFAQWIRDVLLAVDDARTTPILVFPQSFGLPSYRDIHLDGPIFWDKFSVYAIGYLGGCPDYTVPIGEVPYESRITGQQEYLPVSLSIVSRPGQDLTLFDILNGLEDRGVLREVGTGPRLFNNGSPLSNQIPRLTDDADTIDLIKGEASVDVLDGSDVLEIKAQA